MAHVRFADGPFRPVFEADGRQFVVADDGGRVFGVWYVPPDDGPVPLLVQVARPSEDF